MSNEKYRLEIKTLNPGYKEEQTKVTQVVQGVNETDYNYTYGSYENIKPSFLEGIRTWDDDPKIFQFYMNPSNMTVNTDTINKMEKVRGGWIKVGFGLGLTTISFSGLINTQGDDKKKSFHLDWFDRFKYYVESNSAYSFKLAFRGAIRELRQTNPILIGDIKPPQYSVSADNPHIIDYSFTFSGSLLK